MATSFKRMRRKRHPLQYEAKFSESQEEVKNSIAKAEELIKKIEEHIKIKPHGHCRSTHGIFRRSRKDLLH